MVTFHMKQLLVTLFLIIGITIPAIGQGRSARGRPAYKPSARAPQGASLVKVRIRGKIKKFPTLKAAYEYLLKYRLQGGNLAGVTITPPSVGKDLRSPVASRPGGSRTPSVGAPKRAPSVGKDLRSPVASRPGGSRTPSVGAPTRVPSSVIQLSPELKNFHDRVINHKFHDVPTPKDLYDIESLLPPVSELDQFLIDPQILQETSMESMLAAMQDIKDLALSQAGSAFPIVIAALTIPEAAAIVAVVAGAGYTYWKDNVKDYDEDGTPDAVDPEPANPDVPKKQKEEKKEEITAESEGRAGGMMLVDVNKFLEIKYDLLRQYQIHYLAQNQ